MTGAGVAIVRDGRVLLSPRGPSLHLAGPPEPRVHLGWIGGGVLPGETTFETAVREAREEIGCDVELLQVPVTYDEHGRPRNTAVQGEVRPLLRLRDEFDVYRAVVLGKPRPVDVPALAWVPVSLLPTLGAGIPVARLAEHGVDVLGEIDTDAVAFIGGGSVTGTLRALVERFGADVLA